jgi:hypothetical protein
VIIQRSQLGTLTKIGEGGQGDIFQLGPAVSKLVKYDAPVVAKKYHAHKPPRAGAADALVGRATWIRSCDEQARTELLQAAAWPLAVVKDGASLWGIVMPDMRPRYAAQMTLPSGGVKQILVSLEHVLKDDPYLKRRFDVAFDNSSRARVAEAMAKSLAILHRHGIVASDLSQANVLVGLKKPHHVTFIDCDSMVFQGREALTVVETPGWYMTGKFGEQPTTKAADQYKLALAIMRLFARSQSVTGLDDVLPGAGVKVRDLVPDALHASITKAMTVKQRPTAGAWGQVLRTVGGNSAVKTTPKPGKKAKAGADTKKPTPPPSKTVWTAKPGGIVIPPTGSATRRPPRRATTPPAPTTARAGTPKPPAVRVPPPRRPPVVKPPTATPPPFYDPTARQVPPAAVPPAKPVFPTSYRPPTTPPKTTPPKTTPPKPAAKPPINLTPPPPPPSNDFWDEWGGTIMFLAVVGAILGILYLSSRGSADEGTPASPPGSAAATKQLVGDVRAMLTGPVDCKARALAAKSARATVDCGLPSKRNVVFVGFASPAAMNAYYDRALQSLGVTTRDAACPPDSDWNFGSSQNVPRGKVMVGYAATQRTNYVIWTHTARNVVGIVGRRGASQKTICQDWRHVDYISPGG